MIIYFKLLKLFLFLIMILPVEIQYEIFKTLDLLSQFNFYLTEKNNSNNKRILDMMTKYFDNIKNTDLKNIDNSLKEYFIHCQNVDGTHPLVRDHLDCVVNKKFFKDGFVSKSCSEFIVYFQNMINFNSDIPYTMLNDYKNIDKSLIVKKLFSKNCKYSLIDCYKDYIDWYVFSLRGDIPLDIIDKFNKLIKWQILSVKNPTPEFIKKYDLYIMWQYIRFTNCYEYLNYKNRTLDWSTITRNNYSNENFLSLAKDYVDWNKIRLCKEIYSLDFQKKYKNYFDNNQFINGYGQTNLYDMDNYYYI